MKREMKNSQAIYYRIAGLLGEITLPMGVDVDALLPTAKAFKVVREENEPVICRMYLPEGKEEGQAEETEETRLLSETAGVFQDCTRVFETPAHYIIKTTYADNPRCYRMESTKDFSYSTVRMSEGGKPSGQAFTLFLMIAFAQTAVLHQTILIHASTVVKDGVGYAFLGKSGTGKSTHTRLWLNHIEGSRLLNDDNPAIRVKEDGTVHIYGTPWSGKTPCYKYEEAPLGAFTRLEQAPMNRLTPLKGYEAMVALLPSCSSMRWNDTLYTALCDGLEEFIKRIPVFRLECLPDPTAAALAYNGINNNKTIM